MSENVINNDNDDIDDKEENEENEKNEENDKLLDSGTSHENKCIKSIKIIIGIILIILGDLIGIIISIFIMLLTADKSKKAIIAYIAHFFVMFIIISIFTYISTCIMGARQKKRIITGIIMFLVIYALTIAFLLCIFYLPVDYNDDFYKNDNYWDLSTGSRIAYQKYGNNSSNYYPIISLHGGPGIPPNGKDLFGPDLASEGFVVYHYDQFGCGNSNRAKDPKEYTIERQVKDLEEIRKKIGVKKINLIGNSWGGALAANYMAKYNENVNNTIFISPGPIWLGDNSYEQYKK